jgi:glycosyltransferase involved in cell wall biosynthesis
VDEIETGQDLVSILMPVHNGEFFVLHTLHSILRQTHKNWVLVAVLDRCTDSSEEIIRKTIPKEKLILLECSEPGIVAALNCGISLCGSFIARIDCDDVMQDYRLEAQVKFLKRHPKVAVVGSSCLIIDGSGNQVGFRSSFGSAQSIRHRLYVRNALVHPSVMFLKSAVLSVGSYTEGMDGIEDYHLWLRLAKEYDLGVDPTPLTLYRIHDGQTTKSYRPSRLQIWELAKVKANLLGTDELPYMVRSVAESLFFCCDVLRRSIGFEKRVRSSLRNRHRLLKWILRGYPSGSLNTASRNSRSNL